MIWMKILFGVISVCPAGLLDARVDLNPPGRRVVRKDCIEAATPVILSGCGFRTRVPDYPVSHKKSHLNIQSPVKAGDTFPAIFSIPVSEKGVDQVEGYFWWGEAGPDSYEPSKLLKSSVSITKTGKEIPKPALVVIFMLEPGSRVGKYGISGLVTYRDKATGKKMRTNKLNGGVVEIKNPDS
jgi:hypothetical protein